MQYSQYNIHYLYIALFDSNSFLLHIYDSSSGRIAPSGSLSTLN